MARALINSSPKSSPQILIEFDGDRYGEKYVVNKLEPFVEILADLRYFHATDVADLLANLVNEINGYR